MCFGSLLSLIILLHSVRAEYPDSNTDKKACKIAILAEGSVPWMTALVPWLLSGAFF